MFNRELPGHLDIILPMTPHTYIQFAVHPIMGYSPISILFYLLPAMLIFDLHCLELSIFGHVRGGTHGSGQILDKPIIKYDF